MSDSEDEDPDDEEVLEKILLRLPDDETILTFFLVRSLSIFMLLRSMLDNTGTRLHYTVAT